MPYLLQIHKFELPIKLQCSRLVPATHQLRRRRTLPLFMLLAQRSQFRLVPQVLLPQLLRQVISLPLQRLLLPASSCRAVWMLR